MARVQLLIIKFFQLQKVLQLEQRTMSFKYLHNIHTYNIISYSGSQTRPRVHVFISFKYKGDAKFYPFDLKRKEMQLLMS